jgi:glycerol-3-phosphate acyltransferase PlsY
MLLLLSLILAYLLGAVPFSFIVARAVRRIDLRQHGSGNLGATNVFRAVGPRWGVLVLLLDMAKGAGAVLIMSAVAGSWPAGQPTPLHLPPDLWRIFAGFVASLGHTLSPFVSWHGGKGVATTCGAFFVLAPYPTLIALSVFFLVLAWRRIISLASICAALILPVTVAFFEWRSVQFSRTITAFAVLICGWVVFRHRANIRRLRAGSEAAIGAGNGRTKAPAGPRERS